MEKTRSSRPKRGDDVRSDVPTLGDNDEQTLRDAGLQSALAEKLRLFCHI